MVTSRPQNRRLLDRYDLGDQLGRGGMGQVWLADDTVLQRQVAIKEVEFPPGVPAGEAESLRARVMREARAAARLNHPHVTTIYDVVQDDGRTWIVMEYVDAPTMTELVDRRGALSVEDTVAVGLQVLSALQAAHAAGIVHRDVKPSNVMVDATGRAKLADFGVAAVQGDPKITMTGLIIGSPSYMAPEQAREGRSTEATDLWGLGATLYYAVEGEPPFDRGAPIPTLTAVTHEAPRPMERAGALAPIVERLLDKDPAARPTAGELRAELERLDPTGGAMATTEVLSPAPATERLKAPTRESTDAEPVGPAQTQRHGRNPVPLILGVLALLLVAGWLLSGALGGDDGTEVAAPGNEQDIADDEPANDEDAPADDPDDGPDPDEPAIDDTSGTDGAGSDDAAAGELATFAIGDTGSTVDYPQDWEVVQRSATATDLTDPAGGRYLRMDYTDSPKDDPVADWQRQSESFGSRHDDYSEIRIEPVDFRGHDAALWEYTYSEGGAQLHAYNLAIVAGGRGYALNFQTRESQWAESQELWEQFQSSFQPAE
jgi:eukaryotic-like serine/threonine-protein kinase